MRAKARVCIAVVVLFLAAVVPATAQDSERLAGPNRFATAAAVSAATVAPGVAVAYVATGENFPDALAGGPLAGGGGASILLTGRDTLPAETRAELQRLQPGEIVVLGGPASVSDGVVASLQELVDAPVRRLAGASRFATAAAVSAEGFAAGVDNVYIATGGNFPDALAGGAAGAATGSPVLLVSADSVPADTRTELERLQPQSITVLGGAGAVSDDVVQELAGLTGGDVRRLAGASRFATAAAIADDVYADGAPVVYLATGGNFPDALAGGPAAGIAGGPLLLVNAECAPAETVMAVQRLLPERIVVLGGTPVVSDAAAALQPCGGPPAPAQATFAVDPGLAPLVAELPGINPGDPPRPVARLANAAGEGVDFVESELVVVAPGGPELDALVARHGGTIVDSRPSTLDMIDPVHVIRIDPATGDPAGLGDAAMTLQPGATGAHRLSSGAGLGTLAAGMEASADGMVVGLNALPEDDGFLDGTTTEDATAPATLPPAGLTWNRNAFLWEYMSEANPMGIGIADGWRVLAGAGSLGGPVPVGMIDRGFGATDADRPANSVGLGPNFGNASMGSASWHGHNTTSAAVGLADNGFGAAGSAGPGVRLIMSDRDVAGGATSGAIRAILDAADAGARIFSMSFTLDFPQATASMTDPWLRIIDGLWLHHNRTFFGSASNDGADIDQVACTGSSCTETLLRAPCEFDTQVVCVGGVASNTRNRHMGSNYGVSVDVFGPYTTFVGPDPATATVRAANGTSFATPIVAGFAALLWEAYLDQPPFSNPSNLTIERTIEETANPSPDPLVTRVLNAPAAARRALGASGNPGDAPTVQLVNPTGDLTLDYGINRIFEATASDAQDGANCCTLRWTSDVDGLMSVGRQFVYTFATPGLRTVSVVATDGNGNTSAPATFRVDATNTPPALTVGRPLDGEVFFQGVSYTYRGEVADVNEPNLSCDQLAWSTADAVGFTGCRPRIRLGTAGAQSVTASASDAQGATTTVTRNVVVNAIPPNSPPIVVIHRPDPGVVLNTGAPATAEAEATLEPGEVTPVTYEWTLTDPRGTRVLGATLTVQFTCSNPGPSGSREDQTLTFTAQDNDGSASESVAFECERPVA